MNEYADDDAFLTELSRGIDPSGGEDALAQMFLALRADVERQMPPAPRLAGADDEPAVIALAAARTRRRSGNWAAGLVGLAAGIVAVAGTGAVINAATPGTALYPARTALFGADRGAQVVELAATLEELQHRTETGDIDGAKELISKAREQLKANLPADASPITVTVPVPAPAPDVPMVLPEASAPVTVTERVTVTAPVPAPVTLIQTVTVNPAVVAPTSVPNSAVKKAPLPTGAAPVPSQSEAAPVAPAAVSAVSATPVVREAPAHAGH